MIFSKKLAGALVASVLATSGLAADITVDTAKGPVTVPALPETLIVYDLLSLDTLDALGVQLKGKPAKTYVDYIDNFTEDAIQIGSSSEPNYEDVVKLDPDLFVIGGGSSKLMEPLSEIAPTIDMFVRGSDHVDQMLARLKGLGDITGTQDKAAELKAAFNAKLIAAKAAVAGKGNTLMLLTNGGKVTAFGHDSRFGWLFTDVGLTEAVAGIDAQDHGEGVSFEFIADANPDNILVVDRSAAIGREAEAAATTLDNPLVAGTNAGRNGNVIFLSSAPAYVAGGGYQGMMIMLDELISGFADE